MGSPMAAFKKAGLLFPMADRVNPPQRQIQAHVTETDELHQFMERKTIL